MKYAPRKVYIKESGGYVELSYTDFCRRRQADQSYTDKLFIPVQGCLLEVVREQYIDFYKEKERWRYLQKLDTNHSLLSLEGFTDSEGNVLDFVVDEAVDVAETVVHPPARNGGRQRSTRPGRAAAGPGAENRQHHLRGVVPFQHHQQGNHERQNQPPCLPRSGRILIFLFFPHYLLDKPSERALCVGYIFTR